MKESRIDLTENAEGYLDGISIIDGDRYWYDDKSAGDT